MRHVITIIIDKKMLKAEPDNNSRRNDKLYRNSPAKNN